ncbi:hypothetical protein AB0B31_33255 [Catellatospora citrea]|uniref:hypothetical protein n=1 Tax=Catellatospora citrea TaxID=53366 RepID=UPI00340894DD
MGAGTPATVTNNAGDNANVGVQAGTVHEINFYGGEDSASPEDKFSHGMKYLAAGMPGRARELIDAAIVAGHENSKVWFYWLLALLSDRTMRQIDEQDLARLRAVHHRLPTHGNAWAEALRTVLHLFDAVRAPAAEARVVLKELDDLGDLQRDLILRHLNLMLDGQLDNEVWDRTMERVDAGRMANRRTERVWMFFEPRPATPRIRVVEPVRTTFAQRLGAAALTTVMAFAVFTLTWLVSSGDPTALPVYVCSVAGAVAFACYGWRWRSQEPNPLGGVQEQPVPRQRESSPPAGGFAHQVDRSFQHYFAKYAPDGADRATWLIDTANVRRRLRDEVVEIYRERRTSADQLGWLIRFMVGDVKRRWMNGVHLSGFARPVVTVATKLQAAAGFAVMALGFVWSVGATVRQSPLAGLATAALVVVSAVASGKAWLRILLERQRHAVESVEAQRRLAERSAAWKRWEQKIAAKPSDAEMGRWLDFDRKKLMQWVMRHYRLKPSDVIAHAFLEAPASGYTKRARVRNGPWRYSRYRMLVFLLTVEGVRQATADVDFETGVFEDWRRTNYRFDAVASVRVTESRGFPRTFAMALVSGDQIDVKVSESGAERPVDGEDSTMLAEVALDASGLTGTLHVLEGIAAEGKEWVKHEVLAEKTRIQAVSSVLHEV